MNSAVQDHNHQRHHHHHRSTNESCTTSSTTASLSAIDDSTTTCRTGGGGDYDNDNNDTVFVVDDDNDNITSLNVHNIPIVGRENEIELLDTLYEQVCTNCCTCSNMSSPNAVDADVDATAATTTTTTTDNSNPDSSSIGQLLSDENDDENDDDHDGGKLGKSCTASTIFVTLEGEAGSGKSSLIYSRVKEWKTRQKKQKPKNDDDDGDEFRKVCDGGGCIFGAGKYEQTIRPSEPLLPMITALHDLIVGFLISNDVDIEPKREKLCKVIEQDIHIFRKIFPSKTFDIVGLAVATSNDATCCGNKTNQNKTDDGDKEGDVMQQEHCKSTDNHIHDETHQRSHQLQQQSSGGSDMLKLAIWRLVSCLCQLASTRCPIVLFLDDIQWSDHMSLEILKFLALSNLPTLLLIVAYRGEEMDATNNNISCSTDTSSMTPKTFIDAIIQQDSKWCNVHSICLQGGLAVEDVNKVIVSVTKRTIRDYEYTKPLAQIVHKLTNGNPFYVLQLLTLLYKEGFLYYSTSRFQWVWADVTIIEREMTISDNVVDIVSSSMKKLPQQTQTILMVASCFGTQVPTMVLREYYERYNNHAANGIEEADTSQENLPHENLMISLDFAVMAGIIKHDVERDIILWAHDKLQASAYSLIPDAATKVQIHLGLGKLLWKKMMSSSKAKEPWMVYMAADQLNRIPPSLVVTEDASEEQHNDNDGTRDRISRLDLAQLNLEAAKLSISKSAIYPAAAFLRSAVSHLDETTRWKDHYDLCLEVFNSLLEVEFEVGNREASMNAINEVLDNAKSLEDRFRAQSKLLFCVSSGKDRDLDKGMEMAIEVLSSYDVHIPQMNTMFAKWNLYKERKQLHHALPNGQLDSLLLIPQMSDPKQLRISSLLCDHLGRCATDAGNMPLFRIASYRSLRLAVTFGLTHETCSGIIFLSIFYMMKGKFKESYEHAELAVRLVSRFDEVPGSSHCKVIGAAYSSIFPKMRPFHTLLDGLLDANGTAMRIGDMEWVSLTAMMYSLCYLCIGLPLRPLENDLARFLSQARQFGRAVSVCAVFQILQQTITNLHGVTVTSPTSLSGDFMDQDTMLDGMEGKSRSMTLRDISTFRLMLSCVFGDWDTAMEMLEIVSSYPFNDMVSFRGHIRLTYIGLAAVVLGRDRGIRKYKKLGKTIIKRLTNEVKLGAGVNAHPVLEMLLAEERPSKSRYERASRACGRSGLTHHEAYICERSGLFFLTNRAKDEGWAKYYLGRALALYSEYGANGKVAQMRKQYGTLVSNCGLLRSSSTRMSKAWGRSDKKTSSQLLSVDLGMNLPSSDIIKS